MKKRKSLSILLVSMIVITNVTNASTSVFAKENKKFKITTDNYEEMDLVQYVNPLIGTDNFKGNSEWAGTAPLVSAPFGMTNFTPQTRQNRIGDISYMYRDTKFKGFFATHQPAIWMGDYGYVNVMPQIGDVKPDENGRSLSFSHDDEVSTPYYYKVDAGKAEGKPITAEMTATERCAIYNFTYPDTNEAKIFVESARDRGNGQIEINEKNGEISGWNNDNMSSHLNNNPPKNLKGYFVIQFSKPINEKGIYENYEIKKDETKADGQKSGAYISFDANPNEKVEVRIGTSFVSVEQARANIQQELSDKTFDQIKDELKKVWNERLNVLQINGATDDENNIFYTAMYHSLLYPRSFYENVNGENQYFSPYDDKYHKGKSYTDFSIWDTFRAQNSLITLVAPDKVDEMITSLLQTYQEGGYMPKWPNPGYTNIMIGTHADSLVAEAINKGFDGFDYNLAYEAVLKDAMVPQEGDGTTYKWGDRNQNVPYEARGGLSAYKALGYIPNGYVTENVSRTIEFSYDDWCVAQVAKKLGKDDEAKYFLNRSMNYKNAISPDTGYAMGRDLDGNWTEKGQGFTEGDSRKYTWFAPHDPQGLLDYMTEHKNADFYNVELEKAFGGQGGSKWIEHQNEPCHNYAYMFNFSGRPDLTQKYARNTLLESYSNDESGELGNDDCGQMSSWYIFSAMGFYPVNPASGEYMIGSPIFDEVKINNPKTQQQFIIKANNNDDVSNENCYIQSAQLNGKELNIPVITYDEITKGGKVEFNMSNIASDWAKDYRKDAIQYDDTAQGPKDDTKPPFFGDSEVKRVSGINLAKDAKVSATDYADPNGDIDIPSKSLVDGDYDTGYASKNIKSNADLAKSPYYLTMEWDTPKSKVTSFKIWSNYIGSQNPTKMNIEIKNSKDEWKVIHNDWVPEWKDEGNHNGSATIMFSEELKDVKGLRVQIKEGNFTWGKIAVRELEVFEDYSQRINIDNPSDYVANINYKRNSLIKLLFNDNELKEGQDYEFVGDGNKQIKVFGKSLIKGGADSGAKLEFVFNQGKKYVESLVIWENWKMNLESQIKKAEAADYSSYTYSSLEKLAPVLEEAKTVLKDENSTEKEYEIISIKLQEALDNLVEIDKNVEIYDGSLMNIPGIIANVNGQVNDQEGAYQAFDFNVNTKWSCRTNAVDKDGNFWLEVKMPKKYVVDGMGLLSAGHESQSFITKNFKLQVKVNGEWQDALTVTDNKENSYRTDLSKKVIGDEFRLLIPKLSNDDASNARILEFHLYGNEFVDKTLLEKIITDNSSKNSVNYTSDSWVTFETALETAKTVLNDTKSSQEEVDLAYNNLSDALKNLVAVMDKTLLDGMIEKAQLLEANGALNDVHETVVELFHSALANALSVSESDTVLQETINEAYEHLTYAIQLLDFTTNKTVLKALIDECDKIDLDNYETAGQNEFITALKNAKDVYNNPNALDNVSIIKAVDELTKAKGNLVLKQIDTSRLKYMIKLAEETVNNADKYRQDKSWDVFVEKLNAAKDVLATLDNQKAVDKATQELSNAYGNLRIKPDESVIEELKKFLEETKDIDYQKYTLATQNKIKEAIRTVENILSNEDCTQNELLLARALVSETRELINNPDVKVDVKEENIKKETGLATGDNTHLVLLLVVGLLAGFGILITKKKRNNDFR